MSQPTGPAYWVYVGAYTEDWAGSPSPASAGSPLARGIGLFRLDTGSAELTPVDTFPGGLSPTFLALHPTLPMLYAAERELHSGDFSVGALAAYAIEERTGRLQLCSRVASAGAMPAHVSVHPSGARAYISNVQSGHIGVFPLDCDGLPGEADQVIAHAGGRGLNHRQLGPHVHQLRPHPDGRSVLVNDLGLDAVFEYRSDPTGALDPEPAQRVEFAIGSGPRHLARHPDNRHVFVIGELNSTLNVLGYRADGTLASTATHRTVPSDFPTKTSTAEVIVHPSGRAVYVSNRGHDSLAVFSFDAGTGQAEFVGYQETFGNGPRNFNIDPTGRLLLVANQRPGSLVTFRIDDDTLWPTPVGAITPSPSPSCIVFRPVRT